MDTFEFVAALASALAWPVFAFVLILLLRKPITKSADALADRMHRLKSVGGAGVDMEFFQDELEKTQSALELITSADPPANSTEIQIPNVGAVAEASPKAAIVQTWIAVEASLNEAAARAGISPARSVSEKLRLLKVPVPVAESVSTLRMIKNSALREQDFNEDHEVASGYIKTGEEVISILNDFPHRPEIVGIHADS